MRPNLAERAGRWSAAHWKTATLGWLAFVAVAALIGQLAGTAKLADSEQANGEPARAEHALSQSTLRRRAGEAVLVRSSRFDVSDAGFRAELGRVESVVRALPQAIDVRGPLAGHPEEISKDRHAAIVQFDLRGSPETAAERVAPVLARVAALQRTAPSYTIAEFGDASVEHELNATTGRDFSHAESLTLPVTFLVLLLAFGAFVAASVPVLLAFSAVLASLGLSAGASHLVHASGATSSVLLLIGMAVGVDYSLFYLKREREERRGVGAEEALARAAATSGRAVLVSGTTVLIAMAGLLMAGSKIFASMGVGAMIVVFVTMVGSVTVLPALLGRLGDSVERGLLAVLAASVLRLLPSSRRPRLLVRVRERPTLLQRARRSGGGESRVWSAVLGVVLRRPAAAILATASVLIVLAIPALGMHTRLMTYNDLPSGLKVVAAYRQIERSFPGADAPAVVVVQAHDVEAPPVAAAIRRLRTLAASDPQLGGAGGPVSMQVDSRRRLAEIEVPLAGDGADARSYAALARLRDVLLPATIGRVPGASFAVTGETAGTEQFNAGHEGALAGGVRVRARPRVPAAADHVPLDRDRRHRDRAEPAVRRGLLRRARVDLPGRAPAGAARLPVGRRDRDVAAAVHVRRAVRPVDGLSRVHRQSHQGAGRSRREHRTGGCARDRRDSGHGDRGGRRDGRGVRRVRDAVDARNQADGGRPRRGGAARCDRDPRGAAARDDEAARPVELVPAGMARVAAVRPRRAPRRLCAARGRMTTTSRRALARTVREAAFLGSPLVLAGVWLGALVTAWSLTASFAFTPLVVPLAIGTALVVRGCALVEAWLAGGLLGARVAIPPWSWGSGFWRRAWRALTDPWLWRAQAYLLLRLSFGLALAVALTTALAAGLGLLALPFYYWSVHGGVDVGAAHVRSLPGALAAVPVGALLTAVAVALVHPVAEPWRRLSVTLLGGVERGIEQTGRVESGERAVRIHALAAGGVNLFLVVIWALTSRGYFWPIWTIIALALPLAIHALVVFVAPAPWWRDHRLDAGFAIHAGVWAALLLFLTAIWGAAGGGYFWPVWPLLPALVATGAHAAVLLARDPERSALTERISTLETSRAGAVDVQESELRRIERDLHDGAQARLVALGMNLGMAEQKLESDPQAAAELLADARAGAGAALRELRDLARGIHPPVLADRGLDAAIRALAVGSPIAVTVSARIDERPRPPVESAAYFVVAEALANAGKHASARRVDVRIVRIRDVLAVEVHDDGTGGADPAGGGLSGLRRRVEALDGRLEVVSPAGGPTTIRAELPCG